MSNSFTLWIKKQLGTSPHLNTGANPLSPAMPISMEAQSTCISSHQRIKLIKQVALKKKLRKAQDSLSMNYPSHNLAKRKIQGDQVTYECLHSLPAGNCISIIKSELECCVSQQNLLAQCLA